MKYDIPLNFTVVSTNEQKAETQLMEFLIKSIREFGIEYKIADFQYFEFIAKEPCNSRCGNIHDQQGQSTHSKEQACNDTSKGSGSCC